MIIKTIMSITSKIKDGIIAAGRDERGIGVVEVILILVVLIGLVVIFRDQLTSIMNSIFGRIAEDANAL